MTDKAKAATGKVEVVCKKDRQFYAGGELIKAQGKALVTPAAAKILKQKDLIE